MNDDAVILEMLRNSRTIAVVGLSADWFRPSYFAAKYMQEHGYRVIPVNPKYPEILGEKSYASLRAIPEKVDIVDCFQKTERILPLAEDAIAIGARVLWQQIGVVNEAAADLAAARKKIPASDWKALQAARASIESFNRRGRPEGWTARNPHGATVGEKFDPIRRVGLYVPGGEVPLVSTVLMTATLARIAGCPEIAVFTPSNSEGKVAPGLLAALDLLGITEVYRIGGVQAVGAMAYGTSMIPAVDKVFGPGNAYVCEAKRQVFGSVGVDSLPGPSEVMVIADDTARPDFVAADLLAQAEPAALQAVAQAA